jgi:hypothetical protein
MHFGTASGLVRGRKQRGQARLPDPETANSLGRFTLKAFQSVFQTQCELAQGWEGGLAPAVFDHSPPSHSIDARQATPYSLLAKVLFEIPASYR